MIWREWMLWLFYKHKKNEVYYVDNVEDDDVKISKVRGDEHKKRNDSRNRGDSFRSSIIPLYLVSYLLFRFFYVPAFSVLLHILYSYFCCWIFIKDWSFLPVSVHCPQKKKGKEEQKRRVQLFHFHMNSIILYRMLRMYITIKEVNGKKNKLKWGNRRSP